MAATEISPVERVLGPAWESMTAPQLLSRARRFERAGRFVELLVLNMQIRGVETAGEAIAVIAASGGGQ
jgi:hypothetical protein